MSACIRTYTGLFLDLEDPRPSQINLVDIARGLSLAYRWGGHTDTAYTVAEHSISVAACTRLIEQDRNVLMSALMHDAAEAYLRDMPTPAKRLMGAAYSDIEDRITRVIADVFEFSPHLPIVKYWDTIVRDMEAKHLITDSGPLLSALGVESENVGRMSSLFFATNTTPMQAFIDTYNIINGTGGAE